MMAVQARLEVARQSVDPDVAFFLLRAMAADAVFFQKNFKRFRSQSRVGCNRVDQKTDKYAKREDSYKV